MGAHESEGLDCRLLHLALSALPFFVSLYIIESREQVVTPPLPFPPRMGGKHRSRTHLLKEVRSLLSRTFSGFVLARVGFFLFKRPSGSLLFSLVTCHKSKRKMPAASKAKAFQRGGGGGGNNARGHPYPPPQRDHQQLPPPPPQQQQQGNAPSGGGARTTRERSNSSAASDSNAAPNNAKRHLSCEKCVHSLVRKREGVRDSTDDGPSPELTEPNDVPDRPPTLAAADCARCVARARVRACLAVCAVTRATGLGLLPVGSPKRTS